jgi:tRNA dimethylallyltransferase
LRSTKLPLVVIVGPTAVGKTELALALAERLQGEIISADSRLFYRGMDIGTAKPTREDRERVPHHLIDVAEPDETWSLAVFQQAAAHAIADVQGRGKLPFLVGGTGPDWLHARLAALDPAAAESIDARNLRRTVRAMEVILSTGKRFSGQRRQSESPYQSLILGLNRPRAELYERIDARIEAMFTVGLLEEVRGLLERGYSPDLPTMSAIGYRQCVAVLQGRMSVEEAKAQMRRLTRVFVRRQANWFKADDPEIHWFEAGQVQIEEMAALIEKTFKTKNELTAKRKVQR